MRERKFITESVKKLLVSEYIRKETESAGFGSMVMKRTPFGTNITLHVNKPGLVIGRRGSKIQEITENLEKLFQVESPQIEVKEAENPDLNPQVVSKKIALSLEKGWSYRKAGNTSLRRAVDSDVRGIMIRVSGKLTGERSRTQKFFHGSVKYSGEPGRAAMLNGFSIAKMKQGVIGVTVRILDPEYRLPDEINIAKAVMSPGPAQIITPDQKVLQEPEPREEKKEEKPEKVPAEVKKTVEPETAEKVKEPAEKKEPAKATKTPKKTAKKDEEKEEKKAEEKKVEKKAEKSESKEKKAAETKAEEKEEEKKAEEKPKTRKKAAKKEEKVENVEEAAEKKTTKAKAKTSKAKEKKATEEKKTKAATKKAAPKKRGRKPKKESESQEEVKEQEESDGADSKKD